MDQINHLLTDVRQISNSMAQIGVFDHLSRKEGLYPGQFVKNELEFIVITCRSMYESLQQVARTTWESVEYLEGGKMQLPKKFAKIALEDEKPVDLESLKLKRNLPDELAKYYAEEATHFQKIRDVRNKIVHDGESFGSVFGTSDGLAVNTDGKFIDGFSDVWSDETIRENGLARYGR